MPTYIQRKSGSDLETVDQFDSAKEARKMVGEYAMSDPSAMFYTSSRACKGWHSEPVSVAPRATNANGPGVSVLARDNKNAGRMFFSDGAMRFFNSKAYAPTWIVKRDPGASVVAFVTSEQYNEESPRLYTVRIFRGADSSVSTHGDFQAHKTLGDAFAVCETLTPEDL